MEKRSASAALRFMAQGESLYGTVMSMNAQNINVRLHSLPHSIALFEAGTGADLTVLARETMFNTVTEVVTEKAGVIQLLFTTSVRTVQRRRHARLPMEAGINYRLVQDDGCFGSWRTGISKNISSGGMCLTIATGFEVPRTIEMMFALHSQPDETQAAETSGVVTNLDLLKQAAKSRSAVQRSLSKERPLRAIARVCNHKSLPDGRISLGLAFVTMSPEDQIRLEHFLSSPPYPAKIQE